METSFSHGNKMNSFMESLNLARNEDYSLARISKEDKGLFGNCFLKQLRKIVFKNGFKFFDVL